MTTATEARIKAVRECAEPAIAAVEETFEDVRRTLADGRRALQDCAAEAEVQVQRYPLVSLGVAVGLGAAIGCLIGFTVGRSRGRNAS